MFDLNQLLLQALKAQQPQQDQTQLAAQPPFNFMSDADPDQVRSGAQYAMNVRNDPFGGKPDVGGAAGPMTRPMAQITKPIDKFKSPAAPPMAPSVPKSVFPEGYYDKVPQEQRLSGTGISHPGFRWQIYDKGGAPVGEPYANSRRATNRLDKLDNAYGGYRYSKKAIPASSMTEDEQKMLQKYGIDLGK